MYIFSGQEEKKCLFVWNPETVESAVEPENIQAFISALEKLSIDFYSSRLQKFKMGSEKDCLVAGKQISGVDYTTVTVYSTADHPSLVKWLSLHALDLVLEQSAGKVSKTMLDNTLSSYFSKRLYERNHFKIALTVLLNLLIVPAILYLAYYVIGSENELIVVPVVIATFLFSCTAFITGGRTRAFTANLFIPVIAAGYLLLLPWLGFAELADPLSAGTMLMFTFVLSPISGIIGGYVSERLFLTGTGRKQREQGVYSR